LVAVFTPELAEACTPALVAACTLVLVVVSTPASAEGFTVALVEACTPVHVPSHIAVSPPWPVCIEELKKRGLHQFVELILAHKPAGIQW